MNTETLEIKQLARQFAKDELRPHLEKWDRDGALDPAVIEQLSEMGFFGLAEFDAPTMVAALEELAWGEPGVALLVATSPEPTDTLGVQLDARSMRVFPTDNTGERVNNTTGFRTVKLVKGEATAEPTITSLLSVAAIAVGIAQAAVDHALSYADIREQFKTKLREFEVTQLKLGEMAAHTHAARSLLNHAAANPTLAHAQMAKLFASEAAMWISNQAVQIFGGYGYMRDYPVEKLMREAKAIEMLEVPNEILRVEIAHYLYNQEGQ